MSDYEENEKWLKEVRGPCERKAEAIQGGYYCHGLGPYRTYCDRGHCPKLCPKVKKEEEGKPVVKNG